MRKFEEADPIPPTTAQLAEMAEKFGISLEEMRNQMEKENRGMRMFINDLYQVIVREYPSNEGLPLVHLSIKRLDKSPVRDWRHMQKIKNELVGPECEGVELYPAESRLVDTANQYHIWVIKSEEFRFPFGYQERKIIGESTQSTTQRPFEEE